MTGKIWSWHISIFHPGLLQILSQTTNLTTIANHSIIHVFHVTDVPIGTVRPNSKHINHIEESHVVNVFGPKM